MTAASKTTIKTYFETGDKPTQAQFVDLIDSYANINSLAYSVADYGAVGDGVTDDTTAIQNAVAAAYATGALLYWPDDNAYLTTATIPNFHDVRHIGNATVLRGTDVWYIFPKDSSQENKLYYNLATGSNTNDGLTSSQPRQTLVQVRADLLHFNTMGLLAAGYWRLFIAGNGTNPVMNLGQIDLNCSYPIEVNWGGQTLTYNTSATTLWSTAAGNFEHRGSATVTGAGFLTQGWYTARGKTRMHSASTFNITGVASPFYADDGAYFNQDSTTTNTTGATDGMTFNNSNGTDYSIHVRPSYGTTVSRNSTCHVRTAVTSATTAALLINHGSRVDFENGNDYKKCAVGVETDDSGTLSISSLTSLASACNMGTANACTIMAQHFGSSNNGAFTGNSAFPFQLIGARFDSTSLTGTVTATLIAAIYGTTTTGIKQIPAYYFADKGKLIKVHIWGNITGTGGTHTISLRTSNTDGSNVQVLASRSLSTSAGEIDLEFTIAATAITAQKWTVKGIYGGASTIASNGTTAIDFSVDKRILVYGTLANAGDTIAIEGIEMYMSV